MNVENSMNVLCKVLPNEGKYFRLRTAYFIDQVVYCNIFKSFKVFDLSLVLLLSSLLAISYFGSLGETYLVYRPPAQKLIASFIRVTNLGLMQLLNFLMIVMRIKNW